MKPSTAQRRASCVIVLVLLFVATSFAQSTGGRIIGRITDSSGAVVPNAKVTLTSDATSITRNTVSDSSGDYNFPEVAVGTYTVSFEAKGFQKVIRKGVTVDVNQVVTLNTPLAVGAGEQTVEVTGEAPLVETNSTQLGAVVNERSVTELPLNQRDTYQFLQLQPGVMSQLGGNSDLFYGSGSSGSVSVNGGRGRSNNFSVNGGDANDQFVNLPTVQPSPDTIAEFRVLTNTFDAEYGRNSGSVVNVVTKSGTNAWHGDVFEFLRNSVLNSRGFFDTVKPDFIMNQFGGTFGGPIRKDKTFFFASYEGRRIKQGKSSDTVAVPSDAERAGNFGGDFGGGVSTDTMATILNNRCGASLAGGPIPLPSTTVTGSVPYSQIFPNGQIPVQCFDPLSADLLGLIPHANLPNGLFQTVANAIENQDQFTARVDHVLKSNQQLSAYYYFTNHNLLQPFAFFQAAGANVPGFGSLVGERFQQVNISHTWTISNTSVNEFRFTYNREAQATFQHPQHTSDIHQSCPTLTGDACFGGTSPLGINPGLGPNHEGLPFIIISGGATIGNNFEGELPQVGNTFQWSDNFTKIKGNHTLKFGADVRRQRFEQFLFFNVNGEYVFDSSFSPNTVQASDQYANFLLGIPDDYSQGSAQIEHVRDTGVALFAQDSWKIKPNLTLNYGLRWEFVSPIADISGHVQTFRPGQVTTQFPCQLKDPAQIALYGSADCSPTGPAAALNPLGLVFPGDKGIPPGMTQTYYRSFAPRIGLAWSPNADSGWVRWLTGGPGKTSIRTGFGLFYNPIEQLVLEQFGAEPPFGGSNFIGSPQFNRPFLDQFGNTFPNPFVNGVLTPQPGTPIDWSSFRSLILFGEFQPKMRPQYSEQYHLTIQREIGNSMVLQVGYVGSQAHRLLMSHDLNAVPLGLCNQLNRLVPISPGDTNTFDLFCTPNNGDGFYFVDPTTPVPAGMTSITLPYGGPNGGPLTVPLTPGSTVGATAPNGITLVGLRPFSSPLCNPLAVSGSIASHCPIDGLPIFSNIYAQDTIGNSNYNSLQASLEKRFSHGLQFQLAYTYSKSIDQGSSFEDILNPSNFAATRGLSLFDARHRFVVSYYWEFPVPKYTGFRGKALNGWALSGITTFQAGFPIRIVSFDDNEMQSSTFDFIAAGEPDQLAPFHTQDPHNGGCALGTGPTSSSGAACQTVSNLYFDPNIFSPGPAGTGDLTVDPSMLGRYGTAPRTICCGPGINNFDIGLLKATPINERFSLQFRAEFFNAFNHTQFFNPDGSVTDGSDFGRIKRAHDPRLVQFALKLIF